MIRFQVVNHFVFINFSDSARYIF